MIVLEGGGTNVETLQRDGLVRIKATVSRQGKTKICLCTVSRFITYPTSPPLFTTFLSFLSYPSWPEETQEGERHTQAHYHMGFASVCPKKIAFNAKWLQFKNKMPQWLI